VERKMSTKHKILLTTLIILCLISVSSVAMAATPTANFKANAVSGVVPLKVTFSDLSTGSPTSWRWNFGDGIESSTRSATHTYTKAGKYTVKLTVKNPSGSNTATKTGYITVNAGSTTVKPVATFHSPEADLLLSGTTDNAEIDASDAVSFVDDSTGSPTSWSWNFGDGNTSTEKNPTHVYGKQGGYTVTLTVENSAGSNTTIRTCYVLVGVGSILPHAIDFTSTVTTGKAPFAVMFTDLSEANNIYARVWDFGDGTTENVGEIDNASSMIHTYKNPGKYTVTLRNYDGGSSGGAVTKYQYITVTEDTASKIPVPDFTVNKTSGTYPLTVKFSDLSTNNPTSVRWYFGDGLDSSTRNATHTYTKAGTYAVKLVANNSYGSNNITKTGYITVTAPKAPVAAFSASATSGKAPLKVTFADKSTSSPTSWKWNFGDATTSTTQNATHTFTKTGKYTVSLTVKNGVGSNTKTTTSYITVTK
jgi:PKD repeat protein